MIKELKPGILIAAGALALGVGSSPTAAQAPAATTDGEWLTLSGTVVSATPESFLLDYGSRTIPVEMDDYDWYNENAVIPGDRVIVTGRMDAGFWSGKKIEAGSVFIRSTNTLYFASALDEEGDTMPVLSFDPVAGGESVSLTGVVRGIDGEMMTLDAGVLNYTVDVGSLNYDPFDRDGIQRIGIGDRVTVFGTMDDGDLFDRREIDAKAVTELA